MARLLSVNVGLPRDILWNGKTVHTSLGKAPVEGRRLVRRLNVDGDGQGDLEGHGGEHRAVFVYQVESYRHWEKQLGRSGFTCGQFSENFTVEALPDDEVCVGDRYRIGSALFEVPQPRVTCYRVGIRMNEPRMAALLTSSGSPGFYLRVLQEGEVGAGDPSVKVADGPERMTIEQINALLYPSRGIRGCGAPAGRLAERWPPGGYSSRKGVHAMVGARVELRACVNTGPEALLPHRTGGCNDSIAPRSAPRPGRAPPPRHSPMRWFLALWHRLLAAFGIRMSAGDVALEDDRVVLRDLQRARAFPQEPEGRGRLDMEVCAKCGSAVRQVVFTTVEAASALAKDPADAITRGLHTLIEDVVAGRRPRPRSLAEAEGRKR